MFSYSLSWTCHSCNRLRPDDKISVAHVELDMGSVVMAIANVRYCNDDPKCERLARCGQVDFLKKVRIKEPDLENRQEGKAGCR